DVPPGSERLVLVAPSPSQDRGQRLLRAASEGLDGLPVRLLVSTDRRGLELPGGVPRNTRLVDWVPYARVMPRCDVVVCHAGHGTIARALEGGCVPVCVPAAGDMNETSARVDWAGAGVRLPRRLCRPAPVRLAVERALAEPRLRRGAGELGVGAAKHDGRARAAELVEAFAAGRNVPPP